MVVARVLEPVGDDEALVEVLRVLKGEYEPGQRVRMRMHGPDEARGRVFVLSDPEFRMAPRFEVLASEHESEVRWLIARTPVRTVGGAILRLQGLSCESRHAGASFLAQVSPFPAGRLLEALEARYAEGESRAYETRCLVDALMLGTHPAGAIWARRRVNDWLDGESTPIDWADPARWPSGRCRFLTAILGACGDTWSPMFFQDGRSRSEEVHALQGALAARLLAAYSSLDLAAQAEVTYALVRSAAAAPEEIRARLRAGADADGFALGMLRVAVAHDGVCAFDDARTARNAALTAASRPALTAQLREGLARER